MWYLLKSKTEVVEDHFFQKFGIGIWIGIQKNKKSCFFFFFNQLKVFEPLIEVTLMTSEQYNRMGEAVWLFNCISSTFVSKLQWQVIPWRTSKNSTLLFFWWDSIQQARNKYNYFFTSSEKRLSFVFVLLKLLGSNFFFFLCVSKNIGNLPTYHSSNEW